MVSKVIRSAELQGGHALSSNTQPYFRELLEEVKHPTRDLVIVVGAGVSVECGLPSWGELIDELGPDDSSVLTLLDRDNIQRRAMMRVALAREDAPTLSTADLIQRALYKGRPRPTAGELGTAIARFVAAWPKSRSVRVITTNYDQTLESAMAQTLRGQVKSYSLDRKASDGIGAWRSLDHTQARRTVLHVHGLVSDRSGEHRGPVVLTEDEYLVHGPGVVDVLARELRSRTGIFLGLSMTDPNILAALTSLQGRRNSGTYYSVAVPQLTHNEVSTATCAQTATLVARQLEQRFGIRPVLLKSHAQVSQLVNELTLANKLPGRYDLDAPDSIRYGARYGRALEEIYSLLGADRRTARVPAKRAERHSKALNRHFKNQVVPLIDDVRRQFRGEVADGERFGAFVWLRDLLDLDAVPGRGVGGFGLRLVTSSTYAHWDVWSGERIEPISSGSPYVAVLAVFEGQVQLAPVSPTAGRSQSWRSAAAWPLHLGEFETARSFAGRPLDTVMVGSISINSTASLDDPDNLSVFAQASPEDMESVKAALLQAVQSALFSAG